MIFFLSQSSVGRIYHLRVTSVVIHFFTRPHHEVKKLTSRSFFFLARIHKTTMTFRALFSLVLLAFAANTATALMGMKPTATAKKLPLPTFDKESQRWIRNPADDGNYPYDAVGALLRHGPGPFLTRILNADEYEQGVLKYMAVAKVSRAESTGNMDAKINNAADWAYQKMEEKKGAPVVDYTALDKKQAILVSVWAVFITPLTIQVIYKTFSQF